MTDKKLEKKSGFAYKGCVLRPRRRNSVLCGADLLDDFSALASDGIARGEAFECRINGGFKVGGGLKFNLHG